MVQAWYMNDNDGEDQRSERHLTPPKYVDLDQLIKLTGVKYWNIDADNFANDPLYRQIRNEQGYSYEDQLELSKTTVPDYEAKLKTFFTEHMHDDDEVRFIIDGSGYFDLRDKHDKWIRVKVHKNDLLVLPAGIYHRFTLDHKDYVKVIRLFVGQPVWTAFNRPAEDHPARVNYVKSMSS